tara:strand:+ start:841 stop:1365 length:525 start_codon:yes stop_codon:yes gene_type:complete
MDNYIFKKDASLIENECKFCIEYFEKSNYNEKNSRGYSAICTSLDFDQFSNLRKVLFENITEYVQRHSFLSTLYAPWTIEKLFNIQKYNIGDCYKGEHMEHGKDNVDCKRLLGWMIYLNDINIDGGTCWPQQNFVSIPRKGDLYIWPAGWTHSHYGIPAPIEKKYILTGWCSFI